MNLVISAIKQNQLYNWVAILEGCLLFRGSNSINKYHLAYSLFGLNNGLLNAQDLCLRA